MYPYLASTSLTVDTSKVFLYKGQEIYKVFNPSQPKKSWMVSKAGYDTNGRDTQYYYIDYLIRQDITCKN